MMSLIDIRQKQGDFMQDKLLFKLITPDGLQKETDCESVTINISEDENGKNSGSYGIRKGHANAIFSLDDGEITVKNKDEIIYTVVVKGGFALMQDNVLTVMTNKIEISVFE